MSKRCCGVMELVVLLFIASARAEVNDDLWAPLQLVPVTCQQCTIYIDPALADQREAIVAFVETSVAQQRAASEIAEADLQLLPKAIDRICTLLGYVPDAAHRADMDAVGRFFLDAMKFKLAGAEQLQVRVLLLPKLKEYLRGGGKLPDFIYDATSDTCTYTMSLSSSTRDDAAKPALAMVDHFVVPVKSAAEAKSGAITWPFGKPNQLGPEGLGITIHEIAETAAMQRLHFRGPHYRWFSDGLANVITVRVLRDLGENERSEKFDRDTRSGKYEDLRRASNLRYWLGMYYEPQLPLDDDNRLTLARYEFSYELVSGLVDRHGIDMLKRIIDQAGAMEQPTGRDLVRIAGQVSGEDVAALLEAYQEPGTWDELVAGYQQKHVAATDAGDHAAAAIAVKRLIELRWDEDGFTYVPMLYVAEAEQLRAAGYAKHGADVWVQDVTKVSCRVPKVHTAMLRGLIEYAMDCGEPSWAWDAADELLKTQPREALATIVRLHRLAHGSDAKAAAAAKEQARTMIAVLANQNVELLTAHMAVLRKIADEAERDE